MSEEKPITKSFLEQKIHEKAVEHWKSDVQRAFSSFENPLFDKLIIAGDLRKNWIQAIVQLFKANYLVAIATTSNKLSCVAFALIMMRQRKELSKSMNKTIQT
jgi:hypothetical protein